jgi:polar amino acid transport system substrate-binding protein
MDMVCQKAKLKCEFVETAWDGIIPALTSKKIDVIWSSMSITDERKKTIDFTDMYYNGATVLIGKKDGDKDITPAHLKGKTIGVQVSTIHEKYAQKYFASAGALIKTYQTQDEDNQDLAAGRIDYIQADGITLQAFLDDAGKACCELKAQVPDDKDVLGNGVGGGVRKDDADLKGKLNDAIKAVGAAGGFKTLNEKYKLVGQIITP